jgi:hypothetical protein
MRTAVNRLHLPDHPSGWWIGHTLLAVGGLFVLTYAAAVLLVVAGRWLI